MRILVTGSTGFIGSALVPFLAGEGYSVIRLVRKPLDSDDPQVTWDPEAGRIDSDALAGIDGVVHLAGESIAAGRWTGRHKARIRDSRVKGTRLLSETLARLQPPPRVMACASAFGYYGDRGDEILREESSPGSDFLAQVTSQWEASTAPAAQAGIRVVNLRFATVLGTSGGALPRLLFPIRLGVGGRLGSGQQYMSWILLEDALRAIGHVLTAESLKGPINIAAPGAVTNTQFTRTAGCVLSRPTLFPVPRLALRLLLGELADSALASARIEPAKLQATGFRFSYPELEGALRAALGKP